jgi:lysyl-tRNA synthetase class 2
VTKPPLTRVSHIVDLQGPLTIATAGRLHRETADESGNWRLRSGGASVAVDLTSTDVEAEDRDLVRLQGEWDGGRLRVEGGEVVHRASSGSTFEQYDGSAELHRAVRERSELNRLIRDYFDGEEFLEVETPNEVPSPGTDLYLDPVSTESAYLHTSPEFAMKRLLSEGLEQIYQLVKVWRGEERTDLHNPEFTLLEWYRAWEDLDAIMGDVEQVVTRGTGGVAEVVQRRRDGVDERRIDLEPPFPRVTMREVVREACGFDLLEALDYASLREAVVERDLLDSGLDRRHPPPGESDGGRWDELFFELMVSELEPHLASMGAVFVVDWPAELAVLARKSDEDPRVARRFELFVGGVEIANGFDELTDPDEQRRRFVEDLTERSKLEKPQLPMPDQFLQGLEYGLPPSSGVALGVDRLLMLRLGEACIEEVAPFTGDRDA